MQLVDPGYHLAAKREDEIAVLQSGGRRGPPFSARRPKDAGRYGQLIGARESPRDGRVLPRHADVAATNPPIANQPRRDEPRGVARDREAQSLRWQDHRGV